MQARSQNSDRIFIARLLASVALLSLASACSSADVTPPSPSDTPSQATAPTAQPSNTPAPTFTPTSPPTSTPFSIPANTPPPTSTPTASPLPPGFSAVPDVTGLPFMEARQALRDKGFDYLYQDILELAVDQGTVVNQDPPAGTAAEQGTIVMLFRAFHAMQAYAGGECIPIRLIAPSGRVFYWVELDEGENYLIKTDFKQGKTTIFNYLMVVQESFANASDGSAHFKPETAGAYVIGIGPYEIDESRLEDSPGGVNAGCLWIIPPEKE